MFQSLLFDTRDFVASPIKPNIAMRAGCFVDNMKLPVHRWFRYSAGFSADWVRTLLQEKNITKTDKIVLDPFAGIATSLVACNSEGVRSIGIESHPFVFRLAETKLDICHHSPTSLKKLFAEFMRCCKTARKASPKAIPPLLEKCYSDDNIQALFSMKQSLEICDISRKDSRILWFIITSILRPCSHAGTAQWQYVLPNKTKANVWNPWTAFQEKAAQIIEDVVILRNENIPHLARITQADARADSAFKADSVDYVITSPPYPNNYDYADATRLEMTFWNEIKGWSDLHSTIRTHLLCSCTQHSAADRVRVNDVLSDPILDPIRLEIERVCELLGEIRLQKGGKKTYHTMIAAYFRDLALILRNLRRACRKGAELCLVIGDSAPYGVYVPVDRWLGDLAVAQGFESFQFEKIRDRNIKWKNRKHDVPLKEGRLWIKG